MSVVVHERRLIAAGQRSERRHKPASEHRFKRKGNAQRAFKINGKSPILAQLYTTAAQLDQNKFWIGS